MVILRAILASILFACCVTANRVVPHEVRADYVGSKELGFHKFYSDPVPNWEQARDQCEHDGANLSVINSAAEAKILQDMMQPSIYIYAYVGFNDLVREGSYITVTGKPLETNGYYVWAAGEPNNSGGGDKTPGEDCGAITKIGQFNDINCFNDFPFFCEI